MMMIYISLFRESIFLGFYWQDNFLSLHSFILNIFFLISLFLGDQDLFLINTTYVDEKVRHYISDGP